MGERVSSMGGNTIPVSIEKIVSGGQTGVDRAALDVAMLLGIPHGGWCPRGRLAEDGRIPDRYDLRECDSAEYFVRTERNVEDSGGTLILHRGRLTGGTALTARYARRRKRPCLKIDLAIAQRALSGMTALEDFDAWRTQHKIRVLNVAGPRASSCPEIYEEAHAWLLAALERERPARPKG
ncbi:MAG: hypothetical protein RIS70_355 [Planctomycetota bacterium]|jgi:hypothetical protein